ncbi:hypothetical protein KIL84_004428 [Mauremys mutica]|uniref:Uncharacterized protein n=1 Tax=Mauremys mutica TaxID=74926 RepID=A0A9D3XN49_9SAUR|nr:hypothetical protein KIL84_004428 [Mauremys mutica]
MVFISTNRCNLEISSVPLITGQKTPKNQKARKMLHEVMQHSSNENQKVQEWWESERRIRQQNEERQHKSVVLRQQSTDQIG